MGLYHCTIMTVKSCDVPAEWAHFAGKYDSTLMETKQGFLVQLAVLDFARPHTPTPSSCERNVTAQEPNHTLEWQPGTPNNKTDESIG